MYIKVLSVSSLNNYIKKTMDNDFILSNVYVRGEISNLKIHDSGHVYFSLKDEYGKINAVMFRGDAERLQFLPANGMDIEVRGRVSVYPKEGSYQLYCSEMKEVGLGELYAAYLKLKDKLEEEGLFDEKHKKSIPVLPRRIGVITSPTGAAVRDIIHVAKRRNRKVNLLIYPSLVQGKDASNDVIRGIEYLNSVDDIDVIIIARGGGSIEELWAFNNENLAYSVFNSKKPIITGVGHETDFTIVDFVSDRRAPTPSAAAEIAVPAFNELQDRIVNVQSRINRIYETDILKRKYKIDNFKRTLDVNNPVNYIINGYNFVDNLKNRLHHSIDMKLNLRKEHLASFNALLNAHNPMNVLNKGYAVLQDNSDKVIASVESLINQKEINITLKDGKVKAVGNFTCFDSANSKLDR